MAVGVTLAADKPVDLTPFLPAASSGSSAGSSDGDESASGKPAGNAKIKASAATGLLPSSFTLPSGLTAVVNFSAPSVRYGDLDFKTFGLTASWQNQKASGDIKAQLPGDGSFDTAFALSFGSASRAARGRLDGHSVRPDVLSYTVALKTSNGLKTVGISL